MDNPNLRNGEPVNFTRPLLAIVLATSSALASAGPYLVEYSFASGLGATSATNAGDNLVARAYPATSSNPTLSVSGGELTLGTQATSQTFGSTPGKIAGVRPQFFGFSDPSRDLYAAAMAATFNPWVEVKFDLSSMALATSEFFLWGNAPTLARTTGIGIKKDGSYRIYSDSGFINNAGTEALAETLRMQINDGGFMEFLINGVEVFQSTTTYALLSDAVSGSLTMEMRTAGLTAFDSVRIGNFSFGSSYSVATPGSLLLAGVALLALTSTRRRKA